MVAVGIVCEGSHDYFYLAEVVDEILVSRGRLSNTFESLQPKVDATSTQLDGGGFEAVYQWLLANRQIGLRKFFEPTLFATSEIYDIIVVQLDGDVADLSNDFLTSAFSEPFTTVDQRVISVKSWISATVQAEPAHAPSILGAIPTLQMEAWIVAGLQPNAQHIEERSRKRAAKRFLHRRFQGSAVDKVKQAAQESRNHIQTIRNRSRSFDIFCTDLEARFPI